MAARKSRGRRGAGPLRACGARLRAFRAPLSCRLPRRSPAHRPVV